MVGGVVGGVLVWYGAGVVGRCCGMVVGWSGGAGR